MERYVPGKDLKKDVKLVFTDSYYRNSLLNRIKNFAVNILRVLIIIGVAYAILAPVIGIFVGSVSSDSDASDPMMFVLPHFTLAKYSLVLERLSYFKTLGWTLLYTLTLTLIQLFICSMTGYGFARFDFPFKKILFGCVVVMIVLPVHTIMLPLYITFKQFDPLGICTALFGAPKVLMGKPLPMYIMSVLGCGVKSGLYIYIFNQFFRGLPKEIEEAAFVDGAGMFYTYFRIMLRNALPAVVTVSVFSIVWQFNDVFYANLFRIDSQYNISKKISTLVVEIANYDKVITPSLQQLYLDAGIILILVPVVLIYLILQKQFIEGVERSGIVG